MYLKKVEGSKAKYWVYVALTSFFELVWIFGFNTASAWWHWIFILSFIVLDLHFLAKAVEGLPGGTVYAVFAGVGTIGTFLMDVYLFGENMSIGKAIFIALIVIGVIGLKLADDQAEKEESNVHYVEGGLHQ